jgi:hypothetical protein
MTWRKPEPRAAAWRFMTYGPAGIMAVLGVFVLVKVDWVTAFAYAMAGINMWLVARQVAVNYRSGYSTGRLDLMLEQLRLKPHRRPFDPPVQPWDKPADVADAVAMREAIDRLARESPE